ncbi:hypothetical protein SAMN04487826_0018 [Prevotella sp. khp1]|nr:hypothetical protein SAMN04487826_0018 [Prevotella sp. khp1]
MYTDFCKPPKIIVVLFCRIRNLLYFCWVIIYFFIMSKLASRALELFKQQRRLAESDNGQELSLDEINEEIRAVRKGRRQ